jgi:hypothetical protein
MEEGRWVGSLARAGREFERTCGSARGVGWDVAEAGRQQAGTR